MTMYEMCFETCWTFYGLFYDNMDKSEKNDRNTVKCALKMRGGEQKALSR